MLTDRLIKLDTRSRVVIATGLTLIFLYAVYGWVLAPHVIYVRAVQRYEPVAETIRRESALVQGHVTDDQEELEALQEYYIDLRAKLFQYDEAKNFFDALEVQARKYDCRVLTKNMGRKGPIRVMSDASSETTIKGIESTMTMIGQYYDLIRFVQELQDNERGVFIHSLQMVAQDDQQANIRCRIEITVYVSQEKEADYHG